MRVLLILAAFIIATPSAYAAGVSVTAPNNGATVGSPVHFVASASGVQYPIASMIIYVDYTVAYLTYANSLDTYLSIGPGWHNVIIKSWEDVSGAIYQAGMDINVVAGGTVSVSSPVNGANVGAPVHLIASSTAAPGRWIAAMIAYVDNVSAYTAYSNSIDAYLNMGSGQHTILVKAWEDVTGVIYQTAITVNVGQQIPQSRHLILVAEENRSYEDVMARAPFLKSMADSYASATQFYAAQHSSLPALFHYLGDVVTTNNDSTTCYDGDNITRRMKWLGMGWRLYQDGLPYAGYLGLYSAQGYMRRHNPLLYYSETCGSQSNASAFNVPIDYFWSDLASGNLPALSYITPNIWNDMHDGSIEAGDNWLAYAVPPILRRPEFQPGGDGLLIIFFDESNDTDWRCSAVASSGCGGRVATVLIGPQVKKGYQSTVTYHPEHMLATLCAVLRTSCPTNASPMSDMF